MSGVFTGQDLIVSSAPPSSPFVGMRWSRINAGVPESWTWDGTRWLGDPIVAIATGGAVTATTNVRTMMAAPSDYDLLLDQWIFLGRPAQSGSNGGAPINTNTDYHEFRLWPTAQNGSQMADILLGTSQNATLTAGLGWAYTGNANTVIAHKGWAADTSATKFQYLQFRIVKVGANAGNTYDLGSYAANFRYIYS